MFKAFPKYLILFLFMCIHGILLAQMDTAYFYTYGGYSYDHCKDITATTDGGYLTLGTTSSFGNGSSDVYLFKIDSSFNYVWSKTYGGSNVDWGQSIKPTFDNGYIITGYTNSYGAGGYDVYLLKTDSIGELLWSKTYGGPDWDFGYFVQQTPDSGFVICGETYSYGNGNADVYVIKTDKYGDTLWTKTIGGGNKDVGYSLVLSTDGNYVILGETGSFGSGNKDVYLIKLDQLGDTLWTQTYGGTGSDVGFGMDNTVDSGFVLVGSTESFGAGDLDIILIKIDSIGNQLWLQSLSVGGEDDIGNSVKQMPDDGFVIIGSSESFGFGEMDFYILSTDQNGLFQSSSLYGGFDNDEGFSFHFSSNGFVLAGTTESIGAGASDVLIIKVDTINSFYTAIITNFTDNLPSLGVEQEVHGNKEIIIYPNPFKQSTFLIIPNETSKSNFKFSIYDLIGTEVVSEKDIKIFPYQFNRGTLNSGIYFYVLFENDIPLSNGKLIIN